VLAEVQLRGVRAHDIEAIALGRRADGTAVIYVGDLGGNTKKRDTVELYELLEPEVITDAQVPVTTRNVTFDGGAVDAESLLVDPKPGGQVWIVTKRLSHKAAIMALPADLESRANVVATRVGPALWFATDASYAPDGSHYVIRSYFNAAVYDPPVPADGERSFDIPTQKQGEGIAYSSDSKWLYLTSEGKNQALLRMPAPR